MASSDVTRDSGQFWSVATCAMRIVFYGMIALLVWAGVVTNVAYGTLLFQATGAFAVALAVVKFGRPGAAVSICYVGYDLVAALLIGDPGWRTVVRVGSGVVLLVSLSIVALGRSDLLQRSRLLMAVRRGALAGVVLSLPYLVV